MNREFIIKVTIGLYKVSELFPEDEPLRFFLRKKGNEILEKSLLLLLKNPVNIQEKEKKEIAIECIKDIEILQAYFEIGETLEKINKKNFIVLKKAYNNLKEFFEKSIFLKTNTLGREITFSKPKKTDIKKDIKKEVVQQRLKKILEILRTNERMQVWQAKEFFPELSKRTLRRYFDYLVKKGMAERVGEGKTTFYEIKR